MQLHKSPHFHLYGYMNICWSWSRKDVSKFRRLATGFTTTKYLLTNKPTNSYLLIAKILSPIPLFYNKWMHEHSWNHHEYSLVSESQSSNLFELFHLDLHLWAICFSIISQCALCLSTSHADSISKPFQLLVAVKKSSQFFCLSSYWS